MTQVRSEEKEEKLNIESITWGGLTWVDISSPTKKETAYLAEHYHFHPLDLDDCLSRKQLPKIDVYKNYLFVIFQAVVFDKKTRVSSQKQWSAFVGDNYIITLHTDDLRTLIALFRECQTDEESRQEYLSNGSGYLLYRILDRAIDSYFPVLDKILSLMEEVEDAVFDENVETAKELSILRRDIITQRRVMFPTRTNIIELETKLKRFSKIDLTVYFGDLMDHMNKICSTLDETREIIEVFKDTDFVLGTDRLNRVMRVLTIFSTIVLPAIVIASIYGMNVALPGGIGGEGNVFTFIILIIAMIVIAAGMLFFFRHRRWI
jgi:magnesium transporter